MSLGFAVDPAIADRLRVATILLEGVRVEADNPVLAAEIDRVCRELRQRHGAAKSAELPGADATRSLYKAFGIDPTKTRPSSEALARRILRGESLPRINSLVDALNLCSLKHLLPYGLYDRDRIVPPVRLRLGEADESYEGIRKAAVNLEGRPVLADVEGPFGNPTSDSGRTAVSLATTSAWVVVFAPSSFPAAGLAVVAADSAATMVRHCGGRVVETRIAPP